VYHLLVMDLEEGHTYLSVLCYIVCVCVFICVCVCMCVCVCVCKRVLELLNCWAVVEYSVVCTAVLLPSSKLLLVTLGTLSKNIHTHTHTRTHTHIHRHTNTRTHRRVAAHCEDLTDDTRNDPHRLTHTHTLCCKVTVIMSQSNGYGFEE
jgi:hypothetical protein